MAVRPRLLHDVSRRLALLLEEGLAWDAAGPASSDEKVSVVLGHPLDPIEEEEASAGRTTAILYPIRIVPERGLRRPGMSYVPPPPGGGVEGFRGETLWVRVGYAFTVAGGPLERQLGALEAALRTVHDNPLLAAEEGEGGAGPVSGEGEEPGGYPLRLAEDPESWRDLGLAEHRLIVAFEVTLPIESQRFEPYEPVTGRDLRVEAGAPRRPSRRPSR